MKARWAVGLASLAVAVFVSQGWAFCEEHEKAAKAAAQSAEAAKATSCGGHSAAQAETAAAETMKPCCAGKATATAASAEGGKPCCGKPSGCSSSKTWLTVDGPARAVLASLPMMRYRVGDDTLDCPMEAEKMAIKADKPIQYVVGETVYGTKPEATVALAASLEEAAKDLQGIHLVVAGKSVDCPHAASQMAKESHSPVMYRVAGIDFAEREKAESAAKLVAEAAGSVKMSYKVGDESFCCDRMAGMKAKETGKKVSFVVAGEETCCEQTAKLLLAQAKVRAMLEAAANGKA
jgi:hypothetical protein